jgi:hypothetical protein
VTQGLLQRLASRALGLEATTRLHAAWPGVAPMPAREAADSMQAPDEALVRPAPPWRGAPPAADGMERRRNGGVESAAAPHEAGAHRPRQGFSVPASVTTPSSAEMVASPTTPAAPSALPRRLLPARPADPARGGGLVTAPHSELAVPAEAAAQSLPGTRVPRPLLPLQALTALQPLLPDSPRTIEDRQEGVAARRLAGDASLPATAAMDGDSPAERPIEVHVSIGRVELGLPPARAAAAGGSSGAAQRAQAPTLALADYLQGGARREGRGGAGGRS